MVVKDLTENTNNKQRSKIKKYVCKSRTYYKSIVTGNEWSHKGKKDQMVTSEMRVESGRK